MEVENERLSDPLRSKFVTNHQKPYKITKQEHDLTIEIKVMYMRIISSTIVLDMQRWSSMNLIFLSRDHHSCLCINSYKINPCEKISRSFNRHRADALMSESIYVNTDRIKFKGVSLPFEVQLQDCSSSSVLVSGVLRRKLVNAKDDCMWVMECNKEGGIEGNGDHQYFGNGGDLVDVYFAGRSLGKPFLLNGLVEYLKRLEGLDGFPDQGGNETISDDNSKVWKHRWSYIKEGKELDPSKTVREALKAIQDSGEQLTSVQIPREEQIVYPSDAIDISNEEDIVIGNVDGGVQGLKGAAGFVLRASNGNFLFAKAELQDVNVVANLEARAIQLALIEAKGRGIRRIRLLSDALGIVKALNELNSDYPWQAKMIVSNIRLLQHDFDFCRIEFIRRSHNTIADTIVREALQLDSSLSWDNCPESIRALVGST